MNVRLTDEEIATGNLIKILKKVDKINEFIEKLILLKKILSVL